MSAYALLRNPYLFDPELTLTPWTAARGIQASWEYLKMVEKYGIQRNGKLGTIHAGIRYHLEKLNTVYLHEGCVPGAMEKSYRNEAKVGNEEEQNTSFGQSTDQNYYQRMRHPDRVEINKLIRKVTNNMIEWTACIEILEIAIGAKKRMSKAYEITYSGEKNVETEKRLRALAKAVRDWKEGKRKKPTHRGRGKRFKRKERYLAVLNMLKECRDASKGKCNDL